MEELSSLYILLYSMYPNKDFLTAVRISMSATFADMADMVGIPMRTYEYASAGVVKGKFTEAFRAFLRKIDMGKVIDQYITGGKCNMPHLLTSPFEYELTDEGWVEKDTMKELSFNTEQLDLGTPNYRFRFGVMCEEIIHDGDFSMKSDLTDSELNELEETKEECVVSPREIAKQKIWEKLQQRKEKEKVKDTVPLRQQKPKLIMKPTFEPSIAPRPPELVSPKLDKPTKINPYSRGGFNPF